MKKMNYFAAFAIMMAMGSMNANANRVNNRHNDIRVDGRGRVEVRMHNPHHGIVHHAPIMSRHEAERRRMEEQRRMEEARRMEAQRHHMMHHHEAHRVANNVVAGVAAGAAVAAFIGVLAR